MLSNHYLGVWMDHASARLMQIGNPITETIHSDFSHEIKEESLFKSESLMHNKEQHEQTTYYKKIGEEILKYKHVLLFGPTYAKVELLNLLRKDNRFAQIKIEIKQTDHMTLPQELAFVRAYFKHEPVLM
ncbi:MAG: hypothetical protein WCG74_04745 [Sediminibacterium sp.]